MVVFLMLTLKRCGRICCGLADVRCGSTCAVVRPVVESIVKAPTSVGEKNTITYSFRALVDKVKRFIDGMLVNSPTSDGTAMGILPCVMAECEYVLRLTVTRRLRAAPDVVVLRFVPLGAAATVRFLTKRLAYAPTFLFAGMTKKTCDDCAKNG